MRCPSCNKFVSYGDGRVDVGEIEVDDESGLVTAQVELALDCGECGDDLKGTSFDLSAEDDGTIRGHLATPGPHELAVEADEGSKTDRQEGVGRYAKTFYGVEVEYEVTCARHPEWSASGTLSDDCQASGMDELT